MTRVIAMVALLTMFLGSTAAQGQWSNARLLNEPTEAGRDVKSARVVASALGGFHAVYSAGSLRYRRYNGTLKDPVTLFTPLNFNPEITESLTGEVHVVFEDWSSDGPEVGWVRSTDGGVSFSFNQTISTSGGNAKFPHISPIGLSISGALLMSYYNADSHDLIYNDFDGLSWSGQWWIGATGNSEYEIMGMARSRVDGSAYRTFDNGPWLAMRRYDGSGWSGDINLDNVSRNGDGMHNRQQVAVNDSGQVMVIWDQGNKYYSILYVPGVGPGPAVLISDQASWGKGLCAVPDTSDFYVVYPRRIGGLDARRIVGRRFTAGAWQAEENVMLGLPDDFCVDPRVSADPNGSGTLYCTFEYWGSDKPQQYFTIRPGAVVGPTGTLSGIVRDQYGAGVAGAIITLSGAGSALSGAGGVYQMVVPVGIYDAAANKAFYTGDTAASLQVLENQVTTSDFSISGQPPVEAASIRVDEGNTANTVYWQNSPSGNSSGTMIRYSTQSQPLTPSDGALLVDQSGVPGSSYQYSHGGLNNGERVYYTAFAYYQDASRHYGIGTEASGSPAVQADYDRDGDVDQEDFGHFQACLTGSFVRQDDPACADARFDVDEDVDGDDLAIFRNCMGQAETYADPQCAD